MASALALPAPIAVRGDCTGADLVTALRNFAERHGLPLNHVVRALSSHPHNWLSQTQAAARPKPHTVDRVRAILAGPPPAPPEQIARTNAPGLHIVRHLPETKHAATTPAPIRELTRAEILRAEIFAESAARERRKCEAQSGGAVSPLDSVGDQPVQHYQPVGADRRRIVSGREPCRLCAVRADVGCRHQRPDTGPPEIQGNDPP